MFNLLNKISAICRQHWRDLLIIVALGVAAGFTSYQAAQLIDPFILHTWDLWFEGDVIRVLKSMTTGGGSDNRTSVHPLFSLIAYPPVYVLRAALGIEPITAVRLVVAAVASLWFSTLFILLRLIGCRRFDAVLFSVLAATSAAAMFWFVIPETYSFGSLTIMLALVLAALAQHRKLSPLWYVVVNVLTLSITITNWIAAGLATIVNHSRKRSLQIIVSAFCLVIVLSVVEKVIFPNSAFLIGRQRQETEYILPAEAGGPLHIAKTLVFHTMVMPTVKTASDDGSLEDVGDHYYNRLWQRMSIQASPIGSGSPWGIVTVALWIALLGLGLWALFSIKQHPKLRIVLTLTILGQLALHLLYGNESFLYALHFLPLFIVLGALSTLTPARPLTLVLAGILVLSAGLNNSLQFKETTKFVKLVQTERHQVKAQMQLRPADPWARGTGHVVLATPGSREVDKAYYEPGGSFSPSVNSFGVSLWFTDPEGKLKITSDSVPLNELHQQLNWTNTQDIPEIVTETSDYQTRWSSSGPRRWTLKLKTQTTNKDTKPSVVIRSVGPAGGRIRSLDWDGQRLLINNRWSVRINPLPASVYLGEEVPREWMTTEHSAIAQQKWMTERSAIAHWKASHDDGWGYARFELANGSGSDWNLLIEDSTSAPPIKLINALAKSALEINLPDQEFAASLNAQVAHLMMGLVDRQTRPGEPTNYPLSWQRDGAYVVVALAHAGRLEVAKELSTYLAANDFFGGFGPEADAPGLSIWALKEVAIQLNQPDYDQSLWPHVRRKAEFILKMLATDQPIRQPVNGPIVPTQKKDPDLTLVAEPARDGLIIGRMDNHRPLLFINAVSYRGLLDAASLADRVNQPDDAKRWRAKAVELKRAWEKAFKLPESANDRTYISSLWPTWVAASHTDALLQGLQSRWTKLRDARGEFRSSPLWTYFDIAEAHQWLFLNQPDRVWATLRWFWTHQASPGLYTWWEGNGEENTFHLWERVRGWVNPPNVTPHYWTAAEMLLLQIDMLAYTDQAASEPILVIGAGIPKTWLNQPMSVQGLPISKGQVDWNWDGQQMRVKILGNKVNVRLGSVFSPGTPLHIEYLPPQ